MAKRDYYDVLGVSKTSSKDEIDKAYRKKAKQFHPDISTEENAEAKFKEVQEAYENLSDETKRSTYDQFGHDGGPQGFGGQGFGGFEGFSGGFGGFGDIFSDLFGGGGRQTQSNGPQRGNDIEKYMTIDFLEAALGTTKTVKVDVDAVCETCNGSGAKSPKDIHTCSRCNGDGFINVEQRTMFGNVRSQQTCNVCNGTGKEITNKCTTCNGNKTVRKTKTVEVNIPAGVNNNMTLRVAGYGDAGRNGGPVGDLLITFRVKDHKEFRRREDDVFITVPISISEAVLGTTVDIPTIYGEVALKIPSGIQSGTQLKMKDKGIASVRTKRKGDQIVIIKIETPKKLSTKEKQLYEELSKLDTKESKSRWDKFKNLFKN